MEVILTSLLPMQQDPINEMTRLCVIEIVLRILQNRFSSFSFCKIKYIGLKKQIRTLLYFSFDLFKEVVNEMEFFIVPYILFLIGPIMSRMSDQHPSVRRTAAFCFAALIKLLPLDVSSNKTFGFCLSFVLIHDFSLFNCCDHIEWDTESRRNVFRTHSTKRT